MMGYTGRPHLKGVPFLSSQYTKGRLWVWIPSGTHIFSEFFSSHISFYFHLLLWGYSSWLRDAVTVKILSVFCSLFRKDFHHSETDFIIGIKIPFLNWRLKSSNGRLNQSNEYWLDCYINQKFTREIQNRLRLLVSVGLKLQEIVLNFQERFLCIYSTLVCKKLFFAVL